jgi:pimeloyl-ACP methyl ester carboxylesterase
MRKAASVVLAGCVWALRAPAQGELPRRGVVGLQVGTSDGARPAGPENPVVVQRVVEGSAGASAGVQKGDILRRVGGVPVTSAAEFAQIVGRRRAGETVELVLARNGAELTLYPVLKPRPYESDDNAEVLYKSVEVRGARRRVIVTRPKNDGRNPAVLFMQGLGCDSMDGIGREAGYGALVAALEARSYVTMRVEKTGVGDSEGPLCTDEAATPELEAEGYVAGLQALKAYGFVDPGRVFVFAHSMGPVVGSLAVAKEPVRGFVAVETVGTGWFEYDLERSRLQHGLRETPEETDRSLRQYEVCSHKFYVEKAKPAELKKITGCESMTDPFGPVPYTYMQAVADISLGKQWKDADFPVLVVYGTASPVTTAHQSRYLAETINRWHSGRATYQEVQGMGHDLGKYESQSAYLERKPGEDHPFHQGLIEVMMKWIDAVMRNG